MNKNKGFTIVEIIIVSIIVAVLAALAIPRYIKSVEHSKAEEAKVNLQLVHTGQKMYSLDHNTFFGEGDWGVITGTAQCSVCGKYHHYMDDPNSLTKRYFDYSIEAQAPGSFTARATRRAPAPSGYAGKYYQIDQDGNITGPLGP